MNHKLVFYLLSLLSFFSCAKKMEQETRSFYMGVTPWPADFTAVEQARAYQFINTDCDLVSHHFDDGIPYQEALSMLPMPLKLQENLQFRKANTLPGRRILLSVSALNLTRKEKAGYFEEGSVADSVKTRWASMAFDSPQVVMAYVNYVGWLVDQLQPDFVNYGVESNLDSWDPVKFARYKQFLSQVYSQLKLKHPGLPFFVSFMVYEVPQALSLSRELLPYTDYVAISAYPYSSVSSSVNGNTDPALFPADYFTRFAELDASKPFAIAETGYIAEDLSILSFSLQKNGTPAWQQAYLEKLCAFAQLRKARFFVWFCYKDYDAGSQTLLAAGLYQDIFGLWQDTGLYDEAGQPRPALTTWRQWMKRPYRR